MKQPLETEKYLFTKVLKLVQKLVLKSFETTDKVSYSYFQKQKDF